MEDLHSAEQNIFCFSQWCIFFGTKLLAWFGEFLLMVNGNIYNRIENQYCNMTTWIFHGFNMTESCSVRQLRKTTMPLLWNTSMEMCDICSFAPPEVHPSFAALERLELFWSIFKTSLVWSFYASVVSGHCLYLCVLHLTFLLNTFFCKSPCFWVSNFKAISRICGNVSWMWFTDSVICFKIFSVVDLAVFAIDALSSSRIAVLHTTHIIHNTHNDVVFSNSYSFRVQKPCSSLWLLGELFCSEFFVYIYKFLLKDRWA